MSAKSNGRANGSPKAISLALQGGGAHGAFTWGVLDRMLQDERIDIEAISATSAGAMNASVLAYGMMNDGRDGARAALDTFWKRVSDGARLSPLQPSWFDRMTGSKNLEYSPAYLTFDLLSRMMSPYQFNPFNLNPLSDLLDDLVDFDRLRQCDKVKLFISATNVQTGKVRVFENKEMSLEAVLASACLPFMFQTVEVDGSYYWDGGYMGNPAIFPLIYNCASPDVVIVQINPMERKELPTTARDILNRINEISFNSSLMREMRAVAFVTKLIDDGQLKNNSLKRMNMHIVEAEDFMRGFSVSSKLNPDWDFLTSLRDVGRASAAAWLDANFDRIGRESTVDIRARYL
jgi:NTE family protein